MKRGTLNAQSLSTETYINSKTTWTGVAVGQALVNTGTMDREKAAQAAVQACKLHGGSPTAASTVAAVTVQRAGGTVLDAAQAAGNAASDTDPKMRKDAKDAYLKVQYSSGDTGDSTQSVDDPIVNYAFLDDFASIKHGEKKGLHVTPYTPEEAASPEMHTNEILTWILILILSSANP